MVDAGDLPPSSVRQFGSPSPTRRFDGTVLSFSAMRTRVVLVTGARGFLGRPVVELLARRGALVRAAVRTAGTDVIGASQTIAVGDISQRVDWADALRSVDVVVHLAARVHVMRETAADPLSAFRRVNRDATLGLAYAAASAGVRRFVYVSSVKVMGERSSDRAFTELDPVRPADPYAVSKAEAEAGLHEVGRATGLEIVVVRPPLIHGPGVAGNLCRLMALVRRRVPLPFGCVDNRRSVVGVDNLADLLVACAFEPAAAGETFFASDGDPVGTADLIRLIARAFGVSPRLVPIPPGLLRAMGSMVGVSHDLGRLLDSLDIDTSHVARTLGWVAPVPLDEGIRRMVRAYRGDSLLERLA